MRIKRPDTKNACSLVEAAERDMAFTRTLPVTEQSSATIIRNIYESFRMLGDALLVFRGFSSEDHIAPIKELISLPVKASRPLQLLDNLRRLRHGINYYGYKPRKEDVHDVLVLAEDLFPPLVAEIKNLLGRQA